jgi:PP-loop superfamily ATP-utilizing enzyme
MPRLLSLRNTLLPSLKSLGLTYVSLDLQGYRTGSLNEGL